MPMAMDKTDRKGRATREGCEDRHREKGYSPPIKSHMPIWKHREIILSAWNCSLSLSSKQEEGFPHTLKTHFITLNTAVTSDSFQWTTEIKQKKNKLTSKRASFWSLIYLLSRLFFSLPYP